MMQNSKIRVQMMQNIVGNDEMMTEFIIKMKDNQHTMQMMHKNVIMSEECMKSCMKLMGKRRLSTIEMNTTSN